MPYLTRELKAGTFEVEKPSGEHIFITNITLRTEDVCDFPKCWAYVVNKSKLAEYKALVNKVVPSLYAYPQCVFKGDEYWPDGWRLDVSINRQNAPQVVFLTVEYRIELVEKKR